MVGEALNNQWEQFGTLNSSPYMRAVPAPVPSPVNTVERVFNDNVDRLRNNV